MSETPLTPVLEEKRRRDPLLVAFGIFAVVAVLALCACTGAVFAFRDRIFDLGEPGETVITVEAVTADGATPTKDQLERSRDVLAGRIEAADLKRVRVEVRDDGRITARVDGTGHEDELRALAGTGDLRLRKVLATTPDQAGGGIPPTVDTEPIPPLEDVAAALGPAYQAAETIAAPDRLDAATTRELAPFAELTPAQVAALPATMQYQVPTIGCRQLLARPAQGGATGQVAACDWLSPPSKYLLEVAQVDGADVGSAEAKLGPTGQWVVAMTFTEAGQQRWTELTRQVVAEGDNGQVAVVLDGVVISAPTVTAVVTGDAEIGGQFSRGDAMLLAAQLDSDPLPLILRPVA
ncbi:SecDF P1 head subdomain-containing protein [Phytohabitans kaempferiae]|uniref:SecDF P1 head subdomain domain-containing protein n=1 Tax=Phytohabitans kaempferiae TaxID=1620943 RepID=A0ABV6MEU8_9ACTN